MEVGIRIQISHTPKFVALLNYVSIFKVLTSWRECEGLLINFLFSVLDDDNSEEGFNTIHSGRHEYAFSFELPQT